MWAQIIKSRMKPGSEQELASMRSEMESRVGQRPGLIRSIWMQNQKDPQEYYTLIVFDTEEHAREGERAIEQGGGIQRFRTMTDGTPEYVDLNVIAEIT